MAGNMRNMGRAGNVERAGKAKMQRTVGNLGKVANTAMAGNLSNVGEAGKHKEDENRKPGGYR